MGNRMLSDEILLALIKKNSGGGQSAIHVKGVTTTALTDGCNTNPITINGESYTAVDGDLVAYQSKEFLFNGTIWQELGDVSEVMAIIEKILDDIADEFDATTTYAVDDFVVKDSVLYKCISAHTGAWDANDFITTTVVDEIASKQNTLAVGKYIDITNGKISVDRIIPNESFMYNFKILELHTVHVTKTVNGAVVFEQDYTDATASTPIIFDDAIKFYADGYWYFEYELLIDSNSHNAGFKQRWSSLERNINYTEDFDSIDNTGKKLIIKSEMDDAIGALQDGQNIDSFGDVESALSDKQDVLIAGKYINIDANNEISVNPVVPNEAFSYTFTVVDNNSVEIIKTVDGVVVFDEVYSCWDPVAQQSTDVNETFDDAINIHVYMGGERSYTLLIASDTHEAGFKQSTTWYSRDTFTETFSTVDHSGEKLVIKSELDAELNTIKDGTNIDSFGDVETALAGKQSVLTAGKYISIDANNEITVNREIPNVSASYELKTTSTSDPEINTDVIKRVNGEIVWQENYNYQTVRDNPVTIDDVFVLSYSGQWKYKLLVASDDHAAGYEQTWGWSAWVDYTENFSLVDNTGKKLIIKEELDTAINAIKDGTNIDSFADVESALANKQDNLMAGNYIKFEDDEISVKRLVLDGDEYTYDIYSKSTQTHVVVDKYDSNSTLVSTREYYMNDLSPAVEVDGLFTLYAYGGPWTCTLLVASKDHAAGYSFSSQWNEYTHHTEIFELPPEESPNDLIIRSELDAALANKQDKTDNALQTTDKTVVGAVNELKSGLTNVDVALSVPEGTGKNWLPLTLAKLKANNTDGVWSGNTYTHDNVEFTVQTDDNDKVISVNVNGTASANTFIILDKGNFQKYKGMILNGCPFGGSGNTYNIVLQKGSGDYLVYATDIGNGYTLPNTITSDDTLLFIRIFSGYNAENLIFKPMIRPATITDPTFAPYIPSVESRIEAVESAVATIKDGTNIDSFKDVENALFEKQGRFDSSLQTTSKVIPGAINELKGDLTSVNVVIKKLKRIDSTRLYPKMKKTEWINKTWSGLTNFRGDYVWTDGDNIYHSTSSGSYVLDKSTNTWKTKTWSGLTTLRGDFIWTDGVDIYYSNGTNHYVLNKSTNTWNPKTWSGLTDLTNFLVSEIWTDGDNIYYSFGSKNQYVLDKSTNTWNPKTWLGANPIGSDIWTDGDNIYYSNGTSEYQYVLDRSTNTWNPKTWSGLTDFIGTSVWTDWDNIYYSRNSNNYVLDKSTNTWYPKTQSGLTTLRSDFIWTDGDNIYHSNGTNQHVLNKCSIKL